MTKFFSKIRLLPLTIFAASLMLTVKIGDIWDGFDLAGHGAIQVSRAVAQTPDKGEKSGTGETQAASDAAADSGKSKGEGSALEDEKPAKSSKLITEDPTLLTQEEIDLLQELAERRRVLVSREEEMELRTGLLSAAESRIDRKIEELRILRETISGLIKTFDKQQDEKLLRMVKIYENMKPKDAARVFEELDMETLLDVAERMKERKLAPIMASMNPEKARDMTVELVRLRQLPQVGEQIGG